MQRPQRWKIRASDDLTRATDEWVTLERRIDRENDRYYERILDNRGNVIREIDEPLSQHQGRGRAKLARDDDRGSKPT